MIYSNLKDKRYVCLARCSTAQQADTSIPDQLKLLRAFGDEQGMIHVEARAAGWSFSARTSDALGSTPCGEVGSTRDRRRWDLSECSVALRSGT